VKNLNKGQKKAGLLVIIYLVIFVAPLLYVLIQQHAKYPNDTRVKVLILSPLILMSIYVASKSYHIYFGKDDAGKSEKNYYRAALKIVLALLFLAFIFYSSVISLFS